MPYIIQSSIWDQTHAWQNMNDRVEWERVVNQGSLADRRIAQALLTADPATPEAMITEQMTIPGVPNKVGLERAPLTIADIFDGGLPDPHLRDQAPTDYSGGGGSYTGSERGLMSWF